MLVKQSPEDTTQLYFVGGEKYYSQSIELHTLQKLNTEPMFCFVFVRQRPPFLPPPIGNLPPPPGMLFPPGMPPVPASGNPALNPTEEIWVENKTPDGKVGSKSCLCSPIQMYLY